MKEKPRRSEGKNQSNGNGKVKDRKVIKVTTGRRKEGLSTKDPDDGVYTGEKKLGKQKIRQ